MDSNSRAREGKSRFCHANAALRYRERGEVAGAGGKEGAGPAQAQGCVLRRSGDRRSPPPGCALTAGSSSTLHFCCCGGHCTGCLICCCCWQGTGATGTCPGTVTTGHCGGRTTTGVTSCTALTSWQTTPSEPWQDLSLSWQEEPPLWQEELSVLWQPLSAREHIFRLMRPTLGKERPVSLDVSLGFSFPWCF